MNERDFDPCEGNDDHVGAGWSDKDYLEEEDGQTI
jgi:hypothetical protein